MDKGLGKKLKKLRTERGMTQDMVARILHTTRQRYARMENGQADIPFQDIRMLADMFGISASELTAEDEKDKVRSILQHQRPELLRVKGMEELLSLLDLIEEQERIYCTRKNRQEPSQTAVSELQDPSMYEMMRKVRRPALGNGYCGNLLTVLENSGLEIIRFPFSEELSGILIFNGRKYTLITNSARPYEEEMRAAALLAGDFFTKVEKHRQLLYVLTRGDFETVWQKHSEMADFAEELLIPGYELNYYIRYELQIIPSQLRAIHAAQIQNHFQVSYETAERVFLKKQLVSQEQIKRIHKGRRYYGEERLANMLGFSLEYLYNSWNRVRVPHEYVEHALSNYENGYIPFVQLKRIMDVIRVPIGQLAGLRKPQDDRDDWDDSWE